MAMIKCPDCGQEISDKATTCPHCGVSIFVCPECGNALVSNTEACPNCGYVISGSSNGDEEKMNGTDSEGAAAEDSDDYVPPILAAWKKRKKEMTFLEKVKLHILDIAGIIIAIPLAIYFCVTFFSILQRWWFTSTEDFAPLLYYADDMAQLDTLVIVFIVCMIIDEIFAFFRSENLYEILCFKRWTMNKMDLKKELSRYKEYCLSKENNDSKNFLINANYYVNKRTSCLVMHFIKAALWVSASIVFAFWVKQLFLYRAQNVILEGSAEFPWVLLVIGILIVVADIITDQVFKNMKRKGIE